MRWLLDDPESARFVSAIISDAGGKVVGRTRLQKMFYLLTVAGYSDAFTFEYRNYGPYSEELARATNAARLTGAVEEQEHPASWGGTYSIFLSRQGGSVSTDESKRLLLQLTTDANPIDLELAATAIFLSGTYIDPWAETKRRKPEKAKRIESAKMLVQQLAQIPVPNRLPAI